MVSNLNLMESRRRILLNTPHFESLSGSTLSFKTDMASKLKECKIHFTPIQEGTGDPSPDNVRPIVGWDGVTITEPSKNLISFDYCTHLSRSWVNGGVIKSTSSYDLYAFPIPKNTVLTLSRNNNYGSIGCVCSVATEDAVIGKQHLFGLPTMTNRQYYTFNSGEGTWLWFSIVNRKEVSLYEWQLEVGSDRTSYEAPTSLTIPFPQTIYGGYVDLVEGEVVETWVSIASYGGETLPGRWMSDRDVYSAGTIPTTGAQVAYELATSNVYSLTPQVIKTLKGINSIWSDANGNIELKFWTH